VNTLADTLKDIARSQNLRHLAIQEAARNNPTVDALYKIWLIATDTSEDAPVHELNDAITRIERLAKQGLGI
jgi:hypothetical protein